MHAYQPGRFNKFVDCAIVANTDYIVTSDHHYDVLKYIDFPKVHVLHPEEFIKKYLPPVRLN